jgi:hypothetical protein
MEREAGSWFPLFEFQDYSYQSFLLLPTAEQDQAAPGAAIDGKKWAKGTLLCGQAFDTGGGYRLDGTLSFRPGIELAVSAKGALGKGDAPATFEATGTGIDGPLKGAIYELVGWVFPELPIANAAGRVLSVRGSVRAVRGPDAKPEAEAGGMPLGTVGAFVITRAG